MNRAGASVPPRRSDHQRRRFTPAWAASVQSLNAPGGRTRRATAGQPEAALSPASSASVAMYHGAGGQHLRSGGQVGAARCRTQGHDGGQVAEFLTQQEGIKLPLHDDQRAGRAR